MFTKSMKNALFVIIFLVTGLSSLYGGTTGKIAGRVIDANTKEPLIGANVIIIGTTMGAAADIDGEYFILNIPPGVYEVKASLVGFTSVTVTEVKVSVDQTTKLDFELNESAIELGDVIVSAEKSIVQKDLTSTESKVSGEDITMLPLEDVASVINLQAGVVDGHFRGGRIGEVKYLIDGISVNDVYSGESSMMAEVNNIQEVQILTGTFNAEYGEALSGVVNQVTKIAGDDFEGNISFYTGDYVSTRDQLYKNLDDISPKDVYNIQGSLSGPVPGLGNILKFLISGRYLNDDGYLYGKRMFNPSDSSDFSANNPEDWYVGNTGDGEYVPMNFNERFSLNGKLSINIGEGRGIVLNGMYQKRDYREYNHRYFLNPDGDYKRFQESFLGSISYTYVISNAAFIDFSGALFSTEYKQYVFENPLDPSYQSIDKKQYTSGSAFLIAGTENWHFYHKTNTYSGKIDFTYQIDNVHQIKMGTEVKYHELDYEDFQILVDGSNNYKPRLAIPGAFNYNIYSANPYKFAVYIQDKIELDYLIVNAGIRFDYFEPDGEYLVNPDRIAELDELEPPFPDELFEEASAKYQLSPRIGISYPISDKGALHVSYGHFFQVPPFEYLYRNPNFRIPLTGEFPENIGNTIGNADLEPQQTVMYELGLQQELFENFGLTLTGYYKDIRNLLGTEIHIKNEFKKFSKLINRDYGDVKGITVSFEKRFSDGFSANLDYTYQVAKGNASNPNDAYNKAQANPPIEANKQLVPLNWDRRHSLNFTVTAGVPGDYIVSLIGNFGSGLPYTPSKQNQRTGLENSDNKPSIFNVDFYATKYFNLLDRELSLFLKVYNLFDIENELDVFGDTGRAGYTLELTRAQEKPRGVNTLKEYFTRADFYSSPRQIIIGLSLSL